jgi:hypothetical protein
MSGLIIGLLALGVLGILAVFGALPALVMAAWHVVSTGLTLAANALEALSCVLDILELIVNILSLFG